MDIQNKIIELHNPIEKNFLFLCRPCHRKYDNKNSDISAATHSYPLQQSKKIDRIKLWAQKPHQGNSRTIYTYLHNSKENDGVSYQKFISLLADASIYEGNKKKIENNLRSMMTDSGNSHGCIFYINNELILMHDLAYQKVLEWF